VIEKILGTLGDVLDALNPEKDPHSPKNTHNEVGPNVTIEGGFTQFRRKKIKNERESFTKRQSLMTKMKLDTIKNQKLSQ